MHSILLNQVVPSMNSELMITDLQPSLHDPDDAEKVENLQFEHGSAEMAELQPLAYRTISYEDTLEGEKKHINKIICIDFAMQIIFTG